MTDRGKAGDSGRRAITATGSAPAIGPYSAALTVGQMVFLSGQIPLRADGTLVEGGTREQATQVLDNMRVLLAAAGAGFDKVAKTTIYLVDMNDFAVVNEVYATYFSEPFPARATVQVARLPRDVRVEIDAVAVLG